MEYPLIFPKHFEHPKQSRRMKDFNANKKKYVVGSDKPQLPFTCKYVHCAYALISDGRRANAQKNQMAFPSAKLLYNT